NSHTHYHKVGTQSAEDKTSNSRPSMAFALSRQVHKDVGRCATLSLAIHDDVEMHTPALLVISTTDIKAVICKQLRNLSTFDVGQKLLGESLVLRRTQDYACLVNGRVLTRRDLTVPTSVFHVRR